MLEEEANYSSSSNETMEQAVKGGDEVNRERDHFINRGVAETVLKSCPDSTWQLIFALARFVGLRRCELLAIKWPDVDWGTDRLRIDSPKTGLRFCPIFPEIRPFLKASQEAAGDTLGRCVDRYTRAANLGSQMNRIISRAGIPIWEKTFQNLRASRRTELEEQFPNHVVNAWLGHSAKVAEKSYLQVTPEHWKAGASGNQSSESASVGGVTGGVISAAQAGSPVDTETKKPRKKTGFECIGSTRD